MDDYISKPVERRRLEEVIHKQHDKPTESYLFTLIYLPSIGYGIESDLDHCSIFLRFCVEQYGNLGIF